MNGANKISTKVAVGVATAVVIAILAFSWNWATAEIAEYQETKATVAALGEKMQKVDELLEVTKRVAVDLAELKRNSLNVTGRGRVVRTSGAECCIQINRISRAAAYANMKRARITNLSHPDNPSSVVEISGTFGNSDAGYIVKLSDEAGDRIDADVGSTIDLRIEPAD